MNFHKEKNHILLITKFREKIKKLKTKQKRSVAGS